jgi:D-alanyl-D-alanine carboxypeptidase/D-alanyl-D-alanine-endopeptidase (penicillin-binding protein 4)
MLAVDAESGRVLLSRDAHRKFVPASNMKVLVTAAALATLGPDHRFRTEAWGVGGLDPRTGRLEGDLVLVGSGDPTLSERFWGDDLAPLEALADSLRSVGVREVEEALVVDASAWDSTTVAGSWMVSNLPWYYSATGGAFAVGEGDAEVVVRGGPRPGVPATVAASPPAGSGLIVSSVTTVAPAAEEGPADADLDVSWLPESRRIELRGTVPAGAADTLRLAVRDPVRLSAALLHRVLEARGIAVRDGWRVAWDPGIPVALATLPERAPRCLTGSVPDCRAATRIASLASPPLIEVVEGILEPSQNWMTEQLVRLLGASDTTQAGWPAGLAAMERTLVDRVGVDSLDLSLRDGSGLSAYDLVTPRAMVRTLRWIRAQPWGEAYRRALAEPGEEGSTLSGRLPGLEGRVHAKTGTISNVNSLSGYLVTDEGREVVFSILSNGSGLPSRVVRDGIDAVVRELASGG